MFRKWNRFLAFLLSLALVISAFGSDIATARVYAEDTIEENGSGSDDAEPEYVEENDDQGGEDFDLPEDEEIAEDAEDVDAPDEDADDENADGEEPVEGEEPAEGEDPAEPEEPAEGEDAEAADGEEKLVTVTYEAAYGGSVSKESETININDEEAAFEGATASPWKNFTFEFWSKDGEKVSGDATFVPADLTENATFTANFKASETIDEDMPAISRSESTDSFNVSIGAPAGLFPKGTTVSISEISDSQALATAQEAIPSATAAKGVDITFYDADGNEVQPANGKYVSVSLSLKEALEGDNFAVVHDHGDVETIGASISKDGDGNATAASFASGEFSVFIIANNGSPSDSDTEDIKATVTYRFFVGDDTEPINEQTVKEGETLYNPGIPSLDKSLHQEFLGWFTKNGEDFGDEITFGPVGEITSQQDVDVYAKIKSTYYLTFIGQNDEIVRVKRIEVEGTQKPVATVDDVDIKPNDAQEAFVGWALSKAAAANKNVIKNNRVEVDQNDYVYASVIPAYWIHFYENDGGTGGGASYTGPIYVEANVAPAASMPAPPTRKGYTFGGWYCESACTTPFDASVPLTKDTDVYAKWIEAQNTTYTVIIWKQKVTDKKDASVKTYDYETSEVRTGRTNSEITKNTIDSYLKKNYGGFHYANRYEVLDGNGNPNIKIGAKGDTVVNVYYDRNLLTIRFYNGGSVVKTFTGLYGQTLTFNNCDYNWDKNASWYYNNGNGGKTYIPVLDTFKFDNYSSQGAAATELNLHRDNAHTGHTLRYIKQNIDGSYPEDTVYSNTTNIDSLEITEKFDGFKAAQFRRGYGDTNIRWENWTNAKAGTTVNLKGCSYIDIRYERQKYSITFMDGNNTVSAEEIFGKIPYEKELAGYKDDAPDGPAKDGLEFIGWYEDKNGQTPFNWNSTMPAANKVLYAYYTNIKYRVTLEASGGTITGGQSSDFIVNYGTRLNKDSLINNVKKDGFVLVGWYDKATNQPYDYDAIRGEATDRLPDGTPLGHVDLIAKWRNPGLVHIVYDANGGTNPPSDGYGYSEESAVVVGPVPTAPENYAFIGWQITADGKEPSKLFFPNNSFDISAYADYIVDGKITLKAFYEKIGGSGTSTETVIITYNANGGVGADVPKTYRKNENVTALTLADTGFYKQGFNFLGWDKDKNAKEPKIKAGETIIGADNEIDEHYSPNNTLYAIWEEAYGYYVVEYYRGAASENEEDTLIATDEPVECEDGAVINADDIDVDAYRELAGKGYKSGEVDPASTAIVAGETKTIKVIYKPIKATVTVKGNRYSKEYNGQEQSVSFPTDDDLGFTVVDITYDSEDVEDIIDKSQISTKESIGTAGTEVGEYEFGLTEEDFTCSNTDIKLIEYVIDEDGILEITPVGAIIVRITGNTDEKPYNGSEQSVNGFTFTVEPQGKTFTADDFTYKGEAGEEAQQVAAVAKGTDVDEYLMGLEAKDFAAVNEKAYPDVTFVIVEDGKLTITKRKVDLTIKGKVSDPVKKFNGEEQEERGFELTATVVEIEDVETPTFDSADVFFDFDGDGEADENNDAVAKGTAPGEYPMGLVKSMFSLDPEEKNFELGEVVIEDGKLIIENDKDALTITLTAESIETPYNGYTQKYVIRPGIGVVESQNPVQKTIDKIKNAISNFFTITASAADDDLTFEFKDNTYTVTGLQVTAEGRNVGDYDFTVAEGYKVLLGDADVTESFKINDSGLAKKLTIIEATITITADDKQKQVGAAEPDLTATVTGILGEDLEKKADIEDALKAIYNLHRDSGETVGTYKIHNDMKAASDDGPRQEITEIEDEDIWGIINNYGIELVDGTFRIVGGGGGGPTPPPSEPTPPGPPATPPAPPAGAVLGATREVAAAPEAAVLGARRGRTEDAANTTARVIAVIIAAAVAATVLFANKKKEEEEEEA